MQASSTSSLTSQLSSISDTLKQTNSLITRLATLTFQPGSEPLSAHTTARIELAQDIHDTLKQLQDDLDLLTLEADDLAPTPPSSTSRSAPPRDAGDRSRLTAQLARLQDDLRTSHSAFRRAQLSAKKASEAAKQRERELLFSRLSDPPTHQSSSPAAASSEDLFARRSKPNPNAQTLSKDTLELDAAQNITASLRRTHALLTTELSRSRFAQETFDQSTQALAELGEKYNSLDSVLQGSRELLGTLLRSQKSDTWYLESALYVLVGTLVWLFVHRVLWGVGYQLPAFLWRWFVWPVLGTFLSVTGVYAPQRSAVASSALRASTIRPPLIVQPSAKRDSQPRFPEGMAGINVPAGGGGANAKVGKEPLEGRVSEEIGRMAEESERRVREGDEKQEEEEVVRRGDGTVLEDRGDIPVNPKKRVFDAGVDNGGRQEKDEL